MNLWLIVIGMGVITYAIRLSMIVAIGRFNLPENIQRALRYVPPAVLFAIVGPEMVWANDTLNLSLGNPRLISGLVAIGVAYYTKSVLWTIALGMIVLWLLQ